MTQKLRNNFVNTFKWRLVSQSTTIGILNTINYSIFFFSLFTVKAVQSRWKTARDAYMKGRRDGKKPTYKSKQHKYIYQEQLTFLEQAVKDDEGRSKNDDETSNSFICENSANQSTFGVSDDDAGETSDGVMDFDVDIHDDFKDNIKEIVTAIEDDSDKTINDEKQFESLPGTSSQNNDKRTSVAAGDKPHPSRKRLRNAPPRKFKSKMTEFETRLLKVLRLKNTVSTSVLQADDQSFFNSLAPLINNFDDSQKLEFRSKVLEVVMAVGNIGSVKVKQEVETYVFDDLDDINN